MIRKFSPQLEQVEKRDVPSGMISLSGAVSGVLVQIQTNPGYPGYTVVSGQGDGVVGPLGQVHEDLNLYYDNFGGGNSVLGGTVTLSNSQGSITLSVFQQGDSPLYYSSQSATGAFAGDYAYGQGYFSGVYGAPGVPVGYTESF